MNTLVIFSRAVCAALIFLFPLSSRAVTRTWTNGGADDNWNNPANWNPAVAPVNGDDLVFPAGTVATTNNNLTGRTFASLTFNAGTTVAGNAFTVTGGITSSPGGTGGAVVIEPAVTLGGSQTITSGGGALSSLTFEGNVTFGTHVVTVTGARTLTFGGITGSSNAASRFINNTTNQLRFGPSAIFVSPQPLTLSTGLLDVDGIVQTPVTMTGGTLAGGGTLGEGLNATGGNIVPDEDDLTITGDTVLGGAVNLRVRLIGPSDEHALECNGGSVTIQDQATLEVLSPGYTPVRGDVFVVLQKSTAGGIAGVFSNTPLNQELTFGSSVVRATYAGGNGNDLAFTASSTTHTWDGGATLNDNWDEPDNWTGNIAPQSGDVLVFPTGIGSTDRGMDNNFTDPTTFRQFVFNGDDFTVRGSSFRLTHGLTLAEDVRTNVDTDFTLLEDQVFRLGSGSMLHLDTLDSIELAGKKLKIEGPPGNISRGLFGAIDGTISGSGAVEISAGNVRFTANSDYTGQTTILPGARLLIEDRDQALGSAGAGTVVQGHLECETTVSSVTLDEPLVLEGGVLSTTGSGTIIGTTRESDFRGTVELRGNTEAQLLSNPHGDMRISGRLFGSAPVKMRVGTRMYLSGDASNTFTGRLTTQNDFGGSTPLILEKSSAGVIAVSSADFVIQGEGSAVETRQDEQIADNCHVQVNDSAVLNIGNITARTETIETLTLEGGTAAGAGDSQLILKRINSPGTLGGIIEVNTRLTAIDSVVDIPVRLGFVKVSAILSRSGSAKLRKTGEGILDLAGQASVPIQIDRGIVRLNAPLSELVTLNGGTLDGSAGAGGGITSIAGGGSVSPNSSTALTAVLSTGSLLFNAATTLSMQVGTATAGTGYDQLSVTGSVALGGATLTVPLLVPFNAALNQSVILIANDGTDAVTGTFAGLSEGSFIAVPAEDGGGGWVISYKGGTGNDVVLTRVSGPPADPTPVLISVSLGNPDQNGNHPVNVTGRGAPGVSYRLESSVNLQNWSPEGASLTAPAPTGALSFIVTVSPAVRPKQYFRIRKL